jgi:drug/metabolite transporter (DMT)-like permease
VSAPARTARAGLPLTPERSAIQLAFAVVYIVWGVSYSANRIMALSLPPLLAAGARFVLAGTFLTLWARVRRLSFPCGAREWSSTAAAALLGIVIANGLSVLALRHVASNQVALISSSSAFWLAWLGTYGRRATAVSPRTWAGLALGFLGVTVLLSAKGFGAYAQLMWQLTVLGSTLAWALATMVIRESHSDCDPLAFTAVYLVIGGVLLAAVGLASGDAARWTWSPAGLGAIVFLAIFSSTCGFVAYNYLLKHETPARLGTYAYVNPVIAVITGWLVLDEHIDARQIAGAVIIFCGVLLVRKLPLPVRPAVNAPAPARRDPEAS